MHIVYTFHESCLSEDAPHNVPADLCHHLMIEISMSTFGRGQHLHWPIVYFKNFDKGRLSSYALNITSTMIVHNTYILIGNICMCKRYEQA